MGPLRELEDSTLFPARLFGGIVTAFSQKWEIELHRDFGRRQNRYRCSPE